MGDFNCKVGDAITGNTESISKGGKMLLKMINEENLNLVNSLKVCKGKWTWYRRFKETGHEQKSILDYFIINEEVSSTITQAIIDEEKNYTPHRETNGESIGTYSDHRSFIVSMNSSINDNTLKPKSGMTKKGYEKFKKEIEREKVSDIWK